MARVATLAAAVAVGAAGAAAPTPSDVLSVMSAAQAYWLGANNIATVDCDWEWGTYFTGHMAHYNITGNTTLLALANTWAQGHAYACMNVTNANWLACGQSYIDLYLADAARDPSKLNIQYTLDIMMAQPTSVDWTWVDALFMAMPTFARMGSVLGNGSYWEKMYAEYMFTAYLIADRGLWSSTYSLYYRDPTFFNASTPSGKPVFWGRGNGWAIASLVRSLAALPPSSAAAQDYAGKLTAMAARLAMEQGADGMWRSSLLDATEFTNPETTGSALFTYALAWGVNNGALSAATYTPIILNAWNGLSTISLQPNGLVGWCQPVGGAPGAATATDTSSFCVGQFLLAASEVYKLVGGKS